MKRAVHRAFTIPVVCTHVTTWQQKIPAVQLFQKQVRYSSNLSEVMWTDGCGYNNNNMNILFFGKIGILNCYIILVWPLVI